MERFDRYFALTLSSRPDRQSYMKRQLESFIGKDEISEMKSTGKLTIQVATPFPHNELIMNAFNASGKGHFTKPNEFDCARNHYSMVRQAYDDPTCKSVLVFEDDIRFLKDRGIWSEWLANIPQDFDVLQFGAFTDDAKILKYLRPDNPGHWVKHPDVSLWNTSMYALSRKGMSYYLAFMDRFFWVADGPTYKANINHRIINAYISTRPLVIQADKHVIASDIRDEKNDAIDYNSGNMYEANADKSDYLDFEIDPKPTR